MTDRRDIPAGDRDRFVDQVLGRTTGSPCTRAEGQLADLMADRLEGLDRQLVQAHLENCAGCRNLAVAFGWLTPLLPRMAEIEPGPEFLTGVLARTSQRQAPRRISEHPAGAAGLMDRLGCWWEKQILRPGFAMQAAYVATVLIVLLTATPYSPLRNVPSQALQVITAGPQASPVFGPALTSAGSWVEGRSARAVNTGRGRLDAGWTSFEGGIARRTERTATSRHELGDHWHNAIRQTRAGEIGNAGSEFLATLRTWNDVWAQWWSEPELSKESDK